MEKFLDGLAALFFLPLTDREVSDLLEYFGEENELPRQCECNLD